MIEKFSFLKQNEGRIRVLGICDKVIFVSVVNGFNEVHPVPFTEEGLIAAGWIPDLEFNSGHITEQEFKDNFRKTVYMGDDDYLDAGECLLCGMTPDNKYVDETGRVWNHVYLRDPR